MAKRISFSAKERRYEIRVDGILAGFSQVSEDDTTVTFIHTTVLDQFEGQGLAAELVVGALDDVRVRGKKVVARCPCVSRFIKKHRDYADLLL